MKFLGCIWFWSVFSIGIAGKKSGDLDDLTGLILNGVQEGLNVLTPRGGGLEGGGGGEGGGLLTGFDNVGTFLNTGLHNLTAYNLSRISLAAVRDLKKLASDGAKATYKLLNGGKQGECYKELGCFNATEPWFSILRPFPLPQNPEEIQTVFYLSTRKNITANVIKTWPKITLDGMGFDPSKPTVFIVHGFASHGDSSWIRNMTKGYLKNVDANVFVVDRQKGAKKLNYLQVASNTRVVAAELSRLGRHLMRDLGLSPNRIHCVGHSLGSHICGYFGKEMKAAGLQIDWITALDPAQPGFEFFPEDVRVSKNDARFLDAVHSDGLPFIPLIGFGCMEPIGHVDFFPNGGMFQPGCPSVLDIPVPHITSFLDLGKYSVEELHKWIKCPHSRAYDYYTSSMNNCTFLGSPFAFTMNLQDSSSPVNLLKNLNMGLLEVLPSLWKQFKGCTNETCLKLGLGVRHTPLRGSFFVGTSEEKPYCLANAESMPAALFRLVKLSVKGVKIRDNIMKLVEKSFEQAMGVKQLADASLNTTKGFFDNINEWYLNPAKKAVKETWKKSKEAIPYFWKEITHWFKKT